MFLNRTTIHPSMQVQEGISSRIMKEGDSRLTVGALFIDWILRRSVFLLAV